MAETSQILPRAGDELRGFEVKDVYTLEKTGDTCFLLEHEKTGEQLLYIANDDVEWPF